MLGPDNLQYSRNEARSELNLPSISTDDGRDCPGNKSSKVSNQDSSVDRAGLDFLRRVPSICSLVRNEGGPV